jgi:hypothetical protein
MQVVNAWFGFSFICISAVWPWCGIKTKCSIFILILLISWDGEMRDAKVRIILYIAGMYNHFYKFAFFRMSGPWTPYRDPNRDPSWSPDYTPIQHHYTSFGQNLNPDGSAMDDITTRITPGYQFTPTSRRSGGRGYKRCNKKSCRKGYKKSPRKRTRKYCK